MTHSYVTSPHLTSLKITITIHKLFKRTREPNEQIVE
eukprot:CAMPEP_0116075242 /NCGR_PEP_ID=MMETSP0322-20121206/16502_1 /TAXON_ID=163516 /ORGANISM="Leptocylindrus danicus var. apora, Strain B651" /LENGTH=36 /DNA_ID= /DNA_START= /DNA_END= /DNA_ORIENTATION=